MEIFIYRRCRSFILYKDRRRRKIGKLIDLQGNKYGKLKVLYKNSHRSTNGKLITRWHCICDCGNECEKTSQELRSNNNISCGKCSPRKIKNNIKDLSGKRFGKLTVLCIDLDKRDEQFLINKSKKHKSYKTYWKCKCDCGNELTVRSDHLKNGSIVSCGCYQKYIVKNVVPKKNHKLNKFIEKEDYILIKSSNTNDYFKIDKEDYEKIKDYYWHSSHGYAVAPIMGRKNKFVRMHRLIMNCGEEEFMVVDHINHDTTDNRKENLRLVSDTQNNWNSLNTNNSGINYNNTQNKWNVYIHYNLQRINLGLFNTFEEALEIRNKAEKIFYGEYSYSNNEKI